MNLGPGPCASPPPPPPLACSLDAFSEIGTIHLVNDTTADVPVTVKPGVTFPIYFATYVIPGPQATPQTLANQVITTLGPGPHTLDIAVQTNSGIGWQGDLGCKAFPNALSYCGEYPESELIAWVLAVDPHVPVSGSLP